MTWLKRWWHKTSTLMLEQLRQGVSPGCLGLACALALWVGIIPSLGVTTALCAVLAFSLGLNQAAMQAVNFMVYPLQLLLLFPFFRLGAWAFRGPELTVSPKAFLALAARHPWALAKEFWKVGIHALGVWAVLGFLAVPLCWLIFRWVFTRLPMGRKNA
ncbi:MAG: DUF2062 domain-containing protein [bacterium]